MQNEWQLKGAIAEEKKRYELLLTVYETTLVVFGSTDVTE